MLVVVQYSNNFIDAMACRPLNNTKNGAVGMLS